VTADVGVKKGQVITGRVLDGSSRKPLPGFAMVGVLSDNPFLKDFPTFDSSASFRMAETGKDGVFRIVTIPGPVLLMGGPDARKLPGGEVARLRYKPVVPDPKYPQYFDDGPGLTAYHCPGNAFSPLQGNFCKVLEIKPGTEVVSQDIVVEPASALPVKMEDADGMRLTNVWVAGMSSEDWHGPIRVDTCEVYNLQPGKARFVVFYEPMKKLVGSLSLKGDEKDPAIVKLGPAGVVTGRVAGEDGKPLAGVAVSLYHRERTATEIHNQVHRAKGVETDADGKFQIDEVIPGARFALSFGQGKGVYDAVTKPGDRVVKPGEAIDAGEIILKPKSQAGGE
jgi:hypothetical protein